MVIRVISQPVDPFRFLFLADSQLGAYATFSGLTEADAAGYLARGMKVPLVPKVEGHQWDAGRYRSAIELANELRPAFVVVGGDMIDDPASEEQLAELMAITGRLDSRIPLKWVPGNHDVAFDTVAPTDESIERYRSVFGPDYYSFDYEATRFVVLNTSVLDHPEHVPDELEAQFAFVEEALATGQDSAHIVLFGHHPLFVDEADETDSYWNLPTATRHRMLDLIRRYGVRIGFAGHLHRNALAQTDGFEMVTCGPVGVTLGDDPSGLTIVDVDRERVTYRYVPIDE